MALQKMISGDRKRKSENIKDSFLESKKIEFLVKAFAIVEYLPVNQLIEFCLKLLGYRGRKKVKGTALKYLFQKKKTVSEFKKNKIMKLREVLLDDEDAETIARVTVNICDQFNEFKEIINHMLKMELEQLLVRRRKESNSVIEEHLNGLGVVFNLSNLEKDIIIFFYLFSEDRFFNSIFTDEKDFSKLSGVLFSFSRLFRVGLEDIRRAFDKSSTLIKAGILLRSEFMQSFAISSHIVDLLTGINGDLHGHLFEKDFKNDDNIKLDDFFLPQANLKTLIELLIARCPVSILLFGPAGVGKTQLANALVRELKLIPKISKIKNSNGDEDISFRRSVLIAAQNVVDPVDNVLIVDECDNIINTETFSFFCESKADGDKKAWINDYIETSNLKIIWISNQTNGIDESTKRRFSYVQEFQQLSLKQRERVWNIQVDKNDAKFLKKEKLGSYAERFEVSPGNIALAIKDVSLMDIDERDKESRLKNILEQKEKFIYGQRRINPIIGFYSLDGLNVDIDLNQVVAAVQRFYRGELSLEGGEYGFSNLSLLLSGPPGTGKTEFVKYLSRELEKELFVKRASDLLSPYVGMSEKYIAEAFNRAEQNDGILFLDEADSLFVSRNGARHSWEVSQTNELLSQMENFRGVLVCATNFYENMDTAVMRRFAFKIKMDYLTLDGKIKFFNKLFGDVVEDFSYDEVSQRMKLLENVTPGDFKVVMQKTILNQITSTSEILKCLENESKAKLKFVNGKTIKI